MTQKQTRLTNKKLADLLPQELLKASFLRKESGHVLLKAWKQSVNASIASKTEAISFKNGQLLVCVSDATLYTILVREEKLKILHQLRERFPSIKIDNLIFRYGIVYDSTR